MLVMAVSFLHRPAFQQRPWQLGCQQRTNSDLWTESTLGTFRMSSVVQSVPNSYGVWGGRGFMGGWVAGTPMCLQELGEISVLLPGRDGEELCCVVQASCPWLLVSLAACFWAGPSTVSTGAGNILGQRCVV